MNRFPFVLGTVQFGLEYGIANRTGRPAYDEVLAILRAAAEGGVTMLDTAQTYGDSEERLGRAFADEPELKRRLAVTTKVGPLPSGLAPAEASARIEASVAGSLRRLRQDRVACCRFHREENVEYAEELDRLRAKGWIGAAGVSLTTPDGARRARGRAELRAWQVPASVVDRRYRQAGLAPAARRDGVEIFARSVYLQGLLLLDDASTPAHLRPIAEPRRRLRAIAEAFGMEVKELALRAMLGQPDISALVIGAESREQVEENLALFRKGPLPADASRQLADWDAGLGETMLHPLLWTRG